MADPVEEEVLDMAVEEDLAEVVEADLLRVDTAAVIVVGVVLGTRHTEERERRMPDGQVDDVHDSQTAQLSGEAESRLGQLCFTPGCTKGMYYYKSSKQNVRRIR